MSINNFKTAAAIDKADSIESRTSTFMPVNFDEGCMAFVERVRTVRIVKR
jgi:hypothetical protein